MELPDHWKRYDQDENIQNHIRNSRPYDCGVSIAHFQYDDLAVRHVWRADCF